MGDAATNVRVPFVPQNGHSGGDDGAALLQSSADVAAVPVIRSPIPADAAPESGAFSEHASGEWEEPELPGVDDVDPVGTVPAAGEPVVPAAMDVPAAVESAAVESAAIDPAVEPAVIAADERPTSQHPAVVDDPDADATVDGVADRLAAPSAPQVEAGLPDSPQPDPGEHRAAAPRQTHAGQAGFVPPTGPFQQPGPWSGQPAAPFQPQPAAQPLPVAQGQHNSGQVPRPAPPQPFGQLGASVQGVPAPQQVGPQHQQVAHPMGESSGAPMSTASSSFNQQIRFSDAAVRVSGWRAWVRKMGLDVGPSPREYEHAELVHRIRVPKNKFHVTSVFADNSGGTLIVGALGQILERTRADNVVALDLDPDGGDLDQVTAWHQGGATARTLIQQADLSDRNQVDKHLAVTSTNLHVLPTPWRFDGRDLTDYDDVLDLYSIFRPHYSLALVDAGRGLQTGTATGVLEISSALILPASATTRGVRKVAATIDWLRHHGWHGLLANTIVVINHTKRRSSVSVEQFDELFRAGQKLRVHEIPYDPHLDADVPIDLDLLRKRTIRALEGLAADLADGFNSGYEPPAAQKLAALQQMRSAEARG